jgi:hypothetical protein
MRFAKMNSIEPSLRTPPAHASKWFRLPPNPKRKGALTRLLN